MYAKAIAAKRQAEATPESRFASRAEDASRAARRRALAEEVTLAAVFDAHYEAHRETAPTCDTWFTAADAADLKQFVPPDVYQLVREG
jgi:hypothetical protein